MVTSHLEKGVNTGRIQGTERSLEKSGWGGQARERQRQHLSCTSSVPQCRPSGHTRHCFNSPDTTWTGFWSLNQVTKTRRGCGHEATRTGWKEEPWHSGQVTPQDGTEGTGQSPGDTENRYPPHPRWHGCCAMELGRQSWGEGGDRGTAAWPAVLPATCLTAVPSFFFTNPSLWAPAPTPNHECPHARVPAHTPGVGAPVHGIDLGQVSPQRPPGAHLDSSHRVDVVCDLKNKSYQELTLWEAHPPPAPPCWSLLHAHTAQWHHRPGWLCLPGSCQSAQPRSIVRPHNAEAQQLGAGPEPPPPISTLTGHPGPAPPASVRPSKAALPPNYSLLTI